MRLRRLEEVTEFPVWDREMTAAELAEAYALSRAAFTAADLQKYTEIEEGVSAIEFLAELEDAQRQSEQKQP